MLAAAVIACFVAPRAARADEPAADAMIARGISFLLAQQSADGAFREADRHETALTSLSIMALTSAGHMPTDPTKEGEAVRKALAFVLQENRVTRDGYFGVADGSRMYGHGITTLMLTEMLGMGADAAQDELIRQRCQAGVDVILRAQNARKKDPKFRGGWRYFPDSDDSNLSVSGWNIVALRSAHNDGLVVPKESIDAAVDFVKRCYHAERKAYAYSPTLNAPSRELTAAAVLIFMLTDHPDVPEIQPAAARWLQGAPPANEPWLYYACYYVAQATNQLGGEPAERTRLGMEALLRKKQDPTGFWAAPAGREKDAGRIYCTTMAIMSLSVKHHYLPIYQK